MYEVYVKEFNSARLVASFLDEMDAREYAEFMGSKYGEMGKTYIVREA